MKSVIFALFIVIFSNSRGVFKDASSRSISNWLKWKLFPKSKISDGSLRADFYLNILYVVGVLFVSWTRVMNVSRFSFLIVQRFGPCARKPKSYSDSFVFETWTYRERFPLFVIKRYCVPTRTFLGVSYRSWTFHDRSWTFHDRLWTFLTVSWAFSSVFWPFRNCQKRSCKRSGTVNAERSETPRNVRVGTQKLLFLKINKIWDRIRDERRILITASTQRFII